MALLKVVTLEWKSLKRVFAATTMPAQCAAVAAGEKGVRMTGQMDLTWGLALIPFISAGAGAYFGGYLRKKGENLATHEDIEKLVDQVRAVTLATKEIEARVSSDIWNQQKRWELKRETLFEATKRLAELDDALAGLHSMMQVEQQEPKEESDPAWAKIKREKLQKWSNASTALDETRQLVGVVCDNETIRSIDRVGVFANALAGKLVSGNVEIYNKAKEEKEKLYAVARAAIRKELKIDGSS
jgi:hypothetical protein